MSKRKPSLPGVDAIFGSKEPPKPKPLETVPPADEKNKTARKEAVKLGKTKKPGAATKKKAKAASKKVKQNTSAGEGSAKPEPAPIAPGTAATGEELQKYTLYIYSSVEEKLEEVWFKLRRKRKEKIPKWKIVNAILEEHLGDMEQIEKLLERG